MESHIKVNSECKDGVISRSGHLRRRSLKLTSFDSSEEGDMKQNQKKTSPEKNLHLLSKMKVDDDLDGDLSDFDDIDIKEDDEWDLPDDDNSFLKLTDEDFRDDQDIDGLNLPPQDLEFGDEDFDVDDESVDVDDADKDSSAGMAQSLYFSEKQGGLKKGFVKDGQQNRRKKAQRKDKGKSRFTAYMLWAREVRADISKRHPDMDFATVNKKLGELWQLVPTTQKYNWKRRAKRLAVRLRQGGIINAGRGGKSNGAAAGSAGATVTGGSTPGTVHNSPAKQQSSSAAQGVSMGGGAAAGGSGGGGRQAGKRGSPGRGGKTTSPRKAAAQHNKSGGRGKEGRGGGTGAGGGDLTGSPPGYRVTGNSAIDVAAHMKLLGESLNNIGHKLKEHEGQIAVSGSLSVLLDSMLCVLGPLMCLTDQLEETRGAIDPRTHAAILDNIAYIMPGIV